MTYGERGRSRLGVCRSIAPKAGRSGEPVVEIGLQFIEALVKLLANGRGIELFLDGAVKAFADPIGLRVPGLGAAVVDIFHRQVQLVFVMLALAAVTGACVDCTTECVIYSGA